MINKFIDGPMRVYRVAVPNVQLPANPSKGVCSPWPTVRAGSLPLTPWGSQDDVAL